MIYQLTNKYNVAGALAKIERKSDYLTMLMNVCDFILSSKSDIKEYYHYTPQLNDLIIKDSRIFIFYHSDKYVSMYFPFRYCLKDNIFYFGSFNINAITISHIRTIMKMIDDKDGFQKIEEKCNSGVLPTDDEYVKPNDFIIAKLLLEIEPGYVRFDHDIKNANGRIHPLYHLDINYDVNITYKIGVNYHISPERFFNIFNNDLEREHLEDSRLSRKDKNRIIFDILNSLKSFSTVGNHSITG